MFAQVTICLRAGRQAGIESRESQGRAGQGTGCSIRECVYMYACMYVCMYVLYVCAVCMYVLYVCMCCMYVCMYVCMHVCMQYIHIYI